MTKRCGLGFECGSMMQAPGLNPDDCPNYRTCGSGGSADEEFNFVWGVNRESIRLTRQQAAVLMLMRRGDPQSMEAFDIPDLISEIETSLQAVKEALNQFEEVYIAPEQAEVHQYNVKRPSGNYPYNKLTSKEAIFEPSERTEKVKVIHLSHDDDARNVQARLGIERRNKLTQLRTKLREIKFHLSAAQTLLE